MLRALTLAALALVACGPVQVAAARVIEEIWLDPSRDRSIPVRLRLPDGGAADRAAAPRVAAPLVVITRDPAGAQETLSRGGIAWTARGYAVIELMHPGAPRTASTPDGQPGVAPQGGRRARGVTPEQLLGRSDDVRFVLSELQRRQAESSVPGSPWRQIDLARLALAGGGAGARLVQAIAGERYPGPIPSLAEPRIRAFIAVAPATQGIRASAAGRYGAMHRPFLSIVVPPGTDTALPPLPRQLALFDAQPEGGKWRVVPPGAKVAARGTTHDEATASDLVVAFLDRYLREADGADEALQTAAQALRSRGHRVDAK